MPEQDVALEIYYDGEWHDLVAGDDVLTSSPIIIKRGDGDESAAMRPSQITATLANDDDMFRNSNPESPLFGKAGVNTPLRVLVAGVQRGAAEITSWSADQTRDFRPVPRRGSAWVDIEAHGISQRINQWTDEVQSTMIKGMLSFGDVLLGVWPLEDDSQSTILSQLIPGGTSGTFSGDVTLGDSERPAGSGSSLKLGAAGRFGGTFIASTSTTGWQVSFAVKLAALPGSAVYEEIFSWTDSVGRRWTWELNNANHAWTVYAADGSTLSTLATTYSGKEPNQWTRVRMEVSISGGTITYEPAWYIEGDTSFPSSSNTFAATATGQPRTWSAVAATYNVGAWYTGVFAIDDPSVPLFNAGVLADFNGHAGETAGDRFERILTELGISNAVNGDKSLSARMGGQPVATLAELLREIRDTDDAVLFESRAVTNLVLTLRGFRYNLTPALVLNVDDVDNGLPNLPREVTDDLPIHNVVTASQTAGGTYTVEDSTSPMGSAPPPAGRGEYKQTVDVNVYQETTELPQQAWWWLARGTVAAPRFPTLTVNVAALPPWKVTEVEAVTIGSVITITGLRHYTIRLHVIGYTEVIGTHSRMITFTCAADDVFQVGTYGTVRYDSATTTLKTALGPADTAATFRTTNAGDCWDTTAPPYDVIIAGQRNTVLTMGAASLVSGAYDQPATLRRGVDGIRKPLAAGEPIHVAEPGRWAL